MSGLMKKTHKSITNLREAAKKKSSSSHPHHKSKRPAKEEGGSYQDAENFGEDEIPDMPDIAGLSVVDHNPFPTQHHPEVAAAADAEKKGVLKYVSDTLQMVWPGAPGGNIALFDKAGQGASHFFVERIDANGNVYLHPPMEGSGIVPYASIQCHMKSDGKGGTKKLIEFFYGEDKYRIRAEKGDERDKHQETYSLDLGGSGSGSGGGSSSKGKEKEKPKTPKMVWKPLHDSRRKEGYAGAYVLNMVIPPRSTSSSSGKKETATELATLCWWHDENPAPIRKTCVEYHRLDMQSMAEFDGLAALVSGLFVHFEEHARAKARAAKKAAEAAAKKKADADKKAAEAAKKHSKHSKK